MHDKQVKMAFVIFLLLCVAFVLALLFYYFQQDFEIVFIEKDAEKSFFAFLDIFLFISIRFCYLVNV